jgi:hypothetical protein
MSDGPASAGQISMAHLPSSITWWAHADLPSEHSSQRSGSGPSHNGGGAAASGVETGGEDGHAKTRTHS